MLYTFLKTKLICFNRVSSCCLKYINYVFHSILGDRKLFQEFTTNIFAFILNLWNNFTEAFLRDIMQNASTDVITGNLEKALLTLRILRKLTVYGFYKPHLNHDCMCFLKVIFDRAKTTLECSKLCFYNPK